MTLVFLSFVLGTLGAFAISKTGYRLNLIDRPSDRSSHFREIPKGGGAGVLIAFCLTASWIGFPILIWLPAATLSLISLLGDRIDLSPKIRMVTQFIAAGIVCLEIAATFPSFADWHINWIPIGLFFSAFFIVATANLYNFMDGINGIAGITGIVAFGLLGLTGWMRDESSVWVLAAVAMAAAVAGFLPWNFPKARVFMGDVGSILLGFVFAVFILAWSRNLADILMFIAFLFPFYVDEGVTLIARLHSRDSLIQPHRRHIYQILVNQMGISHWKISCLYGIIQLTVSGVAILLYPLGLIILTGWLLLAMTMMGLAGVFVRRHE